MYDPLFTNLFELLPLIFISMTFSFIFELLPCMYYSTPVSSSIPLKKIKSYMSFLWTIARKLLELQCPSFAYRYPYILLWDWVWYYGRPHSTAKIYKFFPTVPKENDKNSQLWLCPKKSLLGLDYFGDKILIIYVLFIL